MSALRHFVWFGLLAACGGSTSTNTAPTPAPTGTGTAGAGGAGGGTGGGGGGTGAAGGAGAASACAAQADCPAVAACLWCQDGSVACERAYCIGGTCLTIAATCPSGSATCELSKVTFVAGCTTPSFVWHGAACEIATGCCAGGCDAVYPTMDDCVHAHTSCPSADAICVGKTCGQSCNPPNGGMLVCNEHLQCVSGDTFGFQCQ